ncbi:asparaginase domain-containing protein [Kineococcus rhizosphaerae]|uniref:asparaginase n=1 Tax=Kineococcus rhizosphaerae TaxID=559628 RepID=A0A2T0QZW1_9ACTN|nr:asparaginase domain-containing protein [Kineococcus rhizosphaerae]PRY12239.1 L-asparaginase [Kineococcus rhizosphaerae]
MTTPLTPPLVVVVTTGGTIASTVDADGVSAPTLAGDTLVGPAAAEVGVRVRVVEPLRVDSSTLTLADAWRVVSSVHEALASPDVAGVVVLHGTDSLEETAYLLDLHHDDPRAVVLTGSQRTSDHPEPDAPANVRLALSTATTRSGVLVAFGGAVLPAAGVAKQHTTALDAFACPDPLPRAVLPAATGDWPRVDVVAGYPGMDGALLDACVAAGARGIVLQGLGSGNATAAVVAAVARAVAAGVAVVLTTRVAAGPVAVTYGDGGGGADLAAAGAVPAGRLKAGQARVLLAALLRAGATDLPAQFAARG